MPSVSSSRVRNHLGKQPALLADLRIFDVAFGAVRFVRHRIEFVFELSPLTVRAHSAQTFRKLPV